MQPDGALDCLLALLAPHPTGEVLGGVVVSELNDSAAFFAGFEERVSVDRYGDSVAIIAAGKQRSLVENRLEDRAGDGSGFRASGEGCDA